MPAEAMVLTSFRAEVLANAVAARAASEALLTSFFVSVILCVGENFMLIGFMCCCCRCF